MNWLPQDITSFIWGLAVAVIGIIASGFLREAGKDLWLALKNKFYPAPMPIPDPVQVDGQFQPKKYAPGDCLWARHESLSRYEQDGFSYYPHPSNGGKVVRGYGSEASYLLVKPNAKINITA